MEFERKWADTAQVVEDYLKQIVPKLTRARTSKLHSTALSRLADSMEYSVFSGGKRFRPVLSLWVGEVLGLDPARVLPFAAAIEMIHSYSLIHDDLPCMDNDDVRRGKPTNHKVFDEATALLAGNALLIEALGWVAKNYEPELANELVEILCDASGFVGMVGGQAIDMSKSDMLTAQELDALHGLKTGALIRAAAEGVAKIAKADVKNSSAIKKYAETLGLAFQVADDILDFEPQKTKFGNYPMAIGIEKTKAYLHELTETAIHEVRIFGEQSWALEQLARYNENRKN